MLYGLWAGGHLLTNLVLHGATAILLFLVLGEMTGALWPCAFVAALFAIHPLRVESVAWVSSRGDVLSGLFFVLTLGAYVRYVREGRLQSLYAVVAVLFLLALLCKASVVALPFVLLLLDYWPLNRIPPAASPRILFRLLLEKVPLMLIALYESKVPFRDRNLATTGASGGKP